MTYKKTWLSYLLWAVYTCLTGVMLANYAILFWQKKINATIHSGTAFFVLFVFGMTTGAYILIRNIFGKTGKKYCISSHTKFLWETFIVLCIFSAGLLYRISLYIQNRNAFAETIYYQMATVKPEEAGEQIIHGASYLYTICLSFVLSFLGNKMTAAVWMQIVIQMAAILLAFFTVRRLAGRIPACIAMLALAVSSVYAEQSLVMTPESLFFALYLAGMFIVGGYVKQNCRNRTDSGRAFRGALLCGFVIGFLTYLDAAALTLLIFLPGLLTGVCCEKAGRKQKKSAKERTVGFSLFLIMASLAAGALAFAGMLALNAYSYYIEATEMAEAWFALYREHLLVDYIFYRTEYSITKCFVLVMLAAFLVMAFWNRRKVQNVTPWFLLMFLLAPTPLAATGVLSVQVYSIFIWGVLAGLGIQQSLVWERTVSRRRDAAEEIASAMKEAASESEPVLLQEPDRRALSALLPEQNRRALSALPPEPDGKPSPALPPEPDEKLPQEPDRGTSSALPQEPAEDHAPDVVEEMPEKPRFLENPLPLPKKHEKRTMDYQHEVAEDRMEFDYEIDEDDDFDIL